MTEYFDHYQDKDPGLVECDNPAAVYEKKLLPDGTWHCLLTEPQKDALGVKYCPYSKAPAKCKGQGVTTEMVDSVEVKTGYPLGAPVHVFGSEVREPGKVYKPGSKDAIVVEAKAIG